jgi:hypothetical protein
VDGRQTFGWTMSGRGELSKGATLIVRLEREAADVPQVSKRAWAWQGVSDVSYLVRRRQPTTACRPTAALDRIDAT